MRVVELKNGKAKPTLNVSKYFLWAGFRKRLIEARSKNNTGNYH